jgi:DNA polymerase-3 subunit alpha
MNKSMMDALIEAGAFDEFEKNRAYIKGNLDKMVEYVHLKNTIGVDEEPILDYIKEDRYRKLEEEKEVLGLYLTTHPLTYVKEKLSIPIVSLCDVSQYVGKSINVIMSISRVKSVVDKRGREMAFIEGQDDTSQQDCVCFSQSYERYKDSLKRGKIVAMEVRVQMRETLSLVVNKVKEIK